MHTQEPLTVHTLHEVAGGYAVPLVALGIVTVLGVALFYWGTAPESDGI